MNKDDITNAFKDKSKLKNALNSVEGLLGKDAEKIRGDMPDLNNSKIF